MYATEFYIDLACFFPSIFYKRKDFHRINGTLDAYMLRLVSLVTCFMYFFAVQHNTPCFVVREGVTNYLVPYKSFPAGDIGRCCFCWDICFESGALFVVTYVYHNVGTVLCKRPRAWDIKE